MDLQLIVVAIVVPVCVLYALWALMGTPARRRVVALLLRLPMSQFWGRYVQLAANTGNACGCGGCVNSTVRQPSAGESPIVVVHRPRG